MQATPTGAAYVEAMGRDPRDREYRRAFLGLVMSVVPRRGTVFDFGSGPGIDARDYAQAGLQVHAYDVDTGMCDYFAAHCAREVDQGSIHLHRGSYEQFLESERPAAGSIDLVVSNFAPLNLAGELPRLFGRFARMLRADGRVLVSVLNPLFAGLTGSRKWWLHLPGLLTRGRYTSRLHGVVPVTRWHPSRLAREAAPHFQLRAIHVPDVAGPGNAPRTYTRLSPRDWLDIADSQFLFLQFEPRA